MLKKGIRGAQGENYACFTRSAPRRRPTRRRQTTSNLRLSADPSGQIDSHLLRLSRPLGVRAVKYVGGSLEGWSDYLRTQFVRHPHLLADRGHAVRFHQLLQLGGLSVSGSVSTRRKKAPETEQRRLQSSVHHIRLPTEYAYSTIDDPCQPTFVKTKG